MTGIDQSDRIGDSTEVACLKHSAGPVSPGRAKEEPEVGWNNLSGMRKDAEMNDQTLSRRELLEKAVLVGAVVWAWPVMASLPGHASTERKRGPCHGNCINCPSSGEPPPCPKEPTYCTCWVRYEHGVTDRCYCGDFRCGNNFICDCPPCQSSDDCQQYGMNWHCTSTCSDAQLGLSPICLPKCGTVGAAPKRPSTGRLAWNPVPASARGAKQLPMRTTTTRGG